MVLVESIFTLAEPILATGFAVGATYLNLERFRYRDKIRRRATALHDELSKKQNYQKYRNFDTVKLIKYLSGLRDHDPMGNDHQSSKEEEQEPPANAGLACWCYNAFYCKHFDRNACVASTGLAFLGLMLGVMAAANLVPYTDLKFTNTFANVIVLVLAVTACLLPLAFIKGGNAIVRRLGSDAQKAFDQIAEVLQDEIAAKATLKSKP